MVLNLYAEGLFFVVNSGSYRPQSPLLKYVVISSSQKNIVFKGLQKRFNGFFKKPFIQTFLCLCFAAPGGLVNFSCSGLLFGLLYGRLLTSEKEVLLLCKKCAKLVSCFTFFLLLPLYFSSTSRSTFYFSSLLLYFFISLSSYHNFNTLKFKGSTFDPTTSRFGDPSTRQ